MLNIKISLKVHKLYVELKLLSKATERRREAEEEGKQRFGSFPSNSTSVSFAMVCNNLKTSGFSSFEVVMFVCFCWLDYELLCNSCFAM